MTLDDHIADLVRKEVARQLAEQRAPLSQTFEPAMRARFPSTKSGWVYAIALIPEIDGRRIKVGYSAKDFEARLNDFRTTSPTAIVIGAWDAHASDEYRAHHAIEGRIGRSEVFDVPDVHNALSALDWLFRSDQ